MAQMSPLDQIIHETKKRSEKEIDRDTEKILIVDVESGKVIDKKPRFSLGRNIRHYLVSSANSVRYEVLNIRVQSVNYEIDITVEYFAQSLPDSERRLVEALHKGIHPSAALDTLIRKWVTVEFIREKTEGPEDFILNYYTYKPELNAFLKNRAEVRAGLLLDTRLKLKDEKELDNVVVDTTGQVTLEGLDETIKLSIKAVLSVVKDNRIRAIINKLRRNEAENILRNAITNHVQENISFHELVYEGDKVDSGLKGIINRLLKGYGRSLSSLAVVPKELSDLPEISLTDKFPVKCDIRNASNISINNTLHLSLIDLGAYKKKEIEDIKQTVKNKIAEITQSVLFDKAYIDLILNFESSEQEIKDKVANAIKRMGYSVRQHLVIPGLRPILLYREGFDLKASEDFETSDAKIKFRMEVVASGRISNLEKISDHLTPSTDLEKKMEEAMLVQLRRHFHTLHPHQVYVHFYEAEYEGRNTIESELISQAKDTLVKQYHVDEDSLSITLKPVPTELIELVNDLRGQTHSFDMGILSLRDGGYSEKVIYQVKFRVITVDKDGWYTFQSRSFDEAAEGIKQIQELLETDIKRRMTTLSGELLRYNDYQILTRIEQLMNDSDQVIREHFGLQVKIGPVIRKETTIETRVNEKLEESTLLGVETDANINKSMLEQKEKLLKGLLKRANEFEMEADAEDEDEIEELHERIGKVRREIRDLKKETDARFRLPAGQDTANNQLDQFDEMRMLGSGTPGEKTDETEKE